MFEIQGKHNTAKVFTDYVEPSAFTQILDLCNMEEYQDSRIRIMPDVHAGSGCVIGLTMTITDCVSPNFVGVDIGCGVVTAVIMKNVSGSIDRSKLDSFIRNQIPTNHNVYKTPIEHALLEEEIPRCFDKLHDTSRYYTSIGTLGGGNHFIELGEDEDNYYLQVHSGSRGVGKQVAEYYQSLANSKGIITGKIFNDYMFDMRVMLSYAQENRIAILTKILRYLYVEHSHWYFFDTAHNYIGLDNILRKGAVKANDKFVIPMNMRDGTLICEAEPLEDWNFSAPHGAGRTMSRSMGKRSLLLEDFEVDMQNIYSSCVNLNTLDEAPAAYKPMDKIVENLGSHISIIKHIKPIYNFKG